MLLSSIQGLLADQLKDRVYLFQANLYESTKEDVIRRACGSLALADLALRRDCRLRKAQAEVVVGLHVAAQDRFEVLVGSDDTDIRQEHVLDGARLDQDRKRVSDPLIRRLGDGHVPDRDELSVLDGDDLPRSLDEVPAARAVVLGSLLEERVRAGRERLEIRLPEQVAVDSDAEERLIDHGEKLLLHGGLEEREIHGHPF